MNTENPTESSFSLEGKLKEIRGILEKMQGATPDFDANVKLFTQGTSLIQECRDYLDRSELMIQRLIEGKNGIELEELEE